MANKRNWDAAKRREWRAEARREKAMEIEHTQFEREQSRQKYLSRKATEPQIRLVKKYQMHVFCGHDDSYLETMTVGQADSIIKYYGKENGWKQQRKPQAPSPKKKAKVKPYEPIKTIFETQNRSSMNSDNIIRSRGPKGNVTKSV